jgi:hypothetical protein
MAARLDEIRSPHRYASAALHGKVMEWFRSNASREVAVPLAEACAIMLDAGPMRFTSPVTTALPDTMDADAEETDDSTLGLLNAEDEETDGPA